MSPTSLNVFRLFALSLLLSTGLSGCATGSTKHATSVVEYLYPDSKDPIEKPSIPKLHVPLRVGIAFVPGKGGGTFGRSNMFQEYAVDFSLSEERKSALMKVVADHFKRYEFIKDIQLIPSTELIEHGSFANLDQIRSKHEIDVIALLSYDQVQFTDEGVASITYLTLIGGYLVPGEKNDTHTLMDAAIYDINSHKMLFRAPGNSHIKSNAIPANISASLRQDSEVGFERAAQDMIVNLDEQLTKFRQHVKDSPDQFKVIK